MTCFQNHFPEIAEQTGILCVWICPKVMDPRILSLAHLPKTWAHVQMMSSFSVQYQAMSDMNPLASSAWFQGVRVKLPSQPIPETLGLQKHLHFKCITATNSSMRPFQLLRKGNPICCQMKMHGGPSSLPACSDCTHIGQDSNFNGYSSKLSELWWDVISCH